MECNVLKNEFLYFFICGCLIGICDLVPAVSGGTMAVILGCYDRLLFSLGALDHKILSFPLTKEKKNAISTLLMLFLGAASAVLLTSPLLDHALNTASLRSSLYAAFFGLVLASTRSLLEKNNAYKNIHYVFFGFVVFFTLHLIPIEKNEIDVPIGDLHKEFQEKELLNASNVDSSKGVITLSKNQYSSLIKQKKLKKNTALIKEHKSTFLEPRWTFFGMLAAGCMLLPGISGSYLLLILGVYGDIIAALTDLTTLSNLKWFSLALLTQFGLGVLIGLILTASVLKKTIHLYPGKTYATLAGFLLASLPLLWPFWSFQQLLEPLRWDRGITLHPIARALPSSFFEGFSALLLACLAFYLLHIAKKKASFCSFYK